MISPRNYGMKDVRISPVSIDLYVVSESSTWTLLYLYDDSILVNFLSTKRTTFLPAPHRQARFQNRRHEPRP